MASSASKSSKRAVSGCYSSPKLSSTAAPVFASSTSSPSPSPSTPLFSCCVSLPGALQPLSLPSSPELSSSSSSSSSASSSVELPPSRDSPSALWEIARLEPCSDSPEVFLFRDRRKQNIGLPLRHRRNVSPSQQHQPQQLLLLQEHKVKQSSSSHHRSQQKRHYQPQQHKSLVQFPSRRDKHGSRSRDDVCKSWELLKSGEISNLIKQGFMERAHRRLSPHGRVSPLLNVQETAIAVATEKTMSPHYVSVRKINPRHHGDALHAASPPSDKAGKSITLFDMMSKDAELVSSKPKAQVPATSNSSISLHVQQRTGSSQSTADASRSRHPLFNNAEGSDVKLTLKGLDGREVRLNLHSNVLVEHSNYFTARLSKTWCKQQQHSAPYVLEIGECEDLETFQETLHLFYCRDRPSRLIKCNVLGVLAILKVAALLLFEACIVSCLEYLEAAPWAEEEEEQVRNVLGQLQIGSFTMMADVLKRLDGSEESMGSEKTLVHLLEMVTKAGKDNKARREMKALVSKMLQENVTRDGAFLDLSKESLYQACTVCLDALIVLFLQASKTDFMNQANEDRGSLVARIAHEADNLLWLLEILLNRHIANDFVRMWAHQTELASVHKRVATVFRFEVSRLTARLCVAIGRGQVLCPADIRYALVQTWLPPLIDDFGWMQRCCKGLDKNVVEDGISQTILTLPLKQQQGILLAWFDRFSSNGDDCPNLQRAFEVWWRRTFVRSSCVDDCSQMLICNKEETSPFPARLS